MSKKMASVLIIYGALLAALSLLLKLDRTQPVAFAAFTGMAAGALSITLGVLATARPRTRTWPVLVVIAANVVFLMHTANVWWKFFEDGGPILTVVLSSLCVLLTFGVLIYLLYAERPPEYWTGRDATPPQTPSSR